MKLTIMLMNAIKTQLDLSLARAFNAGHILALTQAHYWIYSLFCGQVAAISQSGNPIVTSCFPRLLILAQGCFFHS